MEPVIIDPNFMRRETDESESEATSDQPPREYAERAQQLALNGLGLVAPIAVDASRAFLSTIACLVVGLIHVTAALMRDVARPFAAIVVLLAASKLEEFARWLDPKSELRIRSPPTSMARRRSSSRSAKNQLAARARSAPTRSQSTRSLVRADPGSLIPSRLAACLPSELTVANTRANSDAYLILGNDEPSTRESEISVDNMDESDELSYLSVSVQPIHRSSAMRSSVLKEASLSPKEMKRRQGLSRIALLRAQRKKNGKLV